MTIKVCVVEDDSLIREMITQFVSSSGDCELLGHYGTAEDFIESLKINQPEIVLMDIHLPGKNGIECIRETKITHPEIQFIVCTIFEDNENIFDSLLAGAIGYILKSSSEAKIIDSIISAKNGESPMSGTIARKVIDNVYTKQPSPEYAKLLTLREKEILELLSKGYLYKEIADQTKISTETVRTHIRNIYEKLQVNNRTEAINKMFGPK